MPFPPFLWKYWKYVYSLYKMLNTVGHNIEAKVSSDLTNVSNLHKKIRTKKLYSSLKTVKLLNCPISARNFTWELCNTTWSVICVTQMHTISIQEENKELILLSSKPTKDCSIKKTWGPYICFTTPWTECILQRLWRSHPSRSSWPREREQPCSRPYRESSRWRSGRGLGSEGGRENELWMKKKELWCTFCIIVGEMHTLCAFFKWS